MKKILKSAMLVALTAAGFTACSDEYDPGVYTPGDKQREEFAKNFTDYFGEVDPNGTWNAVQQGSVNVTVADLSQVMVYAKGLGVNLQLRSDVLNAGENKTIFFDAPKGVSEVYVIAKNKDSWQSKTIKVGQGESVTFMASAQTRTLPTSYGYGVAHPISYVGNAYSFDNAPDTYASPGGVKNLYDPSGSYNTELPAGTMNSKSFPYPTWGILYAAYPWPCTDSTTRDGLTNNQNTTKFSIEHDDVTLSTALVDAVRNVVGTADNKQDVLEPYTQDITYMTTVEPGEVELTLVSTQTNSNNTIGYYYTKGEKTTAELKAVQKFVLIPNMEAQSVGDKFKLVYFGDNYDEAGTYQFPKDVTIHFFLSRSSGSGISTFNLRERNVKSSYSSSEGYGTTTYENIYGMSVEYMFFSDSELNDVARNSFSSFNFPATAAFNVMGQNCISFEDYPSAGSIDWNDAVFTVDAPFNDFDSFDELQSFIIAMEDLGNTLDFDYNDAVIRVSQANTILKNSGGTQTTVPQPAQVTLMAAGGTLPIKLVYKDGENPEVVLFDEIHDAFGVSSSTPVNVNAPGGVSKAWVSKSWTDAPTSLSMATDASKFKFSVNNGSYDVNVPTATRGESTVPLAFVIPDAETWEWPMENVNITTKYPDFGTWVADNNDADAQLWYNFQWGKTYDPSTPPADHYYNGETVTISDPEDKGKLLSWNYKSYKFSLETYNVHENTKVTIKAFDANGELIANADAALGPNNSTPCEKQSLANGWTIDYTPSLTEVYYHQYTEGTSVAASIKLTFSE